MGIVRISPKPGAKRRSGRPRSLPSRGPHGSGRAGLPHPALRDRDSLRDAEWTRFWQRKPPLDPGQRRRWESALRATTKPPPPLADDAIQKVPHLPPVANAVEIPVVATKLLRESFLLCLEWCMAIAPTPLGDAPEGPSEAVCRCSQLHRPLARDGFTPVDGEAEEVEGTRLVESFRTASRTAPRTSKRKDPCLVRVQLETVPSESLREHGHHAVSVFLVLE